MGSPEQDEGEIERPRERIFELVAAIEEQPERRHLLFRNLPHMVFLKDQDP